MGLDAWFYAYPKGKRWDDMDEDNYEKELHYFRKHSDLNGLLQRAWLDKNPNESPDNFNCTHFPIDKKLVKLIEKVAYLDEEERKPYSGFFWGHSTEDDWKEVRLELIPKLKEALREGKTIIYHPWW